MVCPETSRINVQVVSIPKYNTSKVWRNNNTINGSREESEVAGFFAFSNILMMGYFRLG